MPKKTNTLLIDNQIYVDGLESADAAIVIITAFGEDDQVFSASGTAKRGSGDRYVPGVGATLATARALENMARKLRKEVRDFL